LNDASIIELFFERNEKAISELQNKYSMLLEKVTGNLLNRKEDIEECINSTFLSIWNSIPPERPDNLCAYTCKIAKRHAIDRLKYYSADKRNDNLTVSLSELECCLADKEFTDDSISVKQLSDIISSFLRSQSELNRNLFIRRYWYTDSIETIAKLYDLNERTVTTKLFRIRKKLKEHLMKEGYIFE